MFEAYAQLIVFPEQTWVVKRELTVDTNLSDGPYSALNAISINRRSGRTAVTQVIEEGNKRLRSGIWVTIFPEGTRMPPGETKKFGISGAALAKAANVNIVPVAHNAEDVWVSRQLRKKTRHGSILHRQANRNKRQRKPKRLISRLNNGSIPK